MAKALPQTPWALDIRLDDLTDPRIEGFMNEHLRDMRATSPPESVHALDIAQLRQPGIRFWTAWVQEATSEERNLVATGALKSLEPGHAELKSMRTAAQVRGSGVGSAMLEHLMAQARAMGLQRLSLETGTQPFFEPAWRLYLRHGFADCAPFGNYQPDPHSRFMTRIL